MESSLLQRQPDGLFLKFESPESSSLKKMKPFKIDFVESLTKPRNKDAKSELVCRAVGNANVVVDLTAGLGRDSFVLASSGYTIKMVERNEGLFLLLEDGISRLKSVNPSIGSRMTLLKRSSCSINNLRDLQIEQNESVAVYVDLMYPANKVGKKAMVKKETQILHHLVSKVEGEDEVNNRAVFETALKLATTRVVVKRPINAEPLLSLPPHAVIKGSTQRFDIYFANQRVSLPSVVHQ